ncbi:MAG: isopentenyl-diphosphate Delta-isomerase [Clostridia bacterium]|nr:isopentenyl-diphosphate Delta-isomerase [Clostridia bacterium]
MRDIPDNMTLDPAKGEMLILTDALDRPVGEASKEAVHRGGLLHRAFSAVLYRERPEGLEFLLTRRAEGKYHSGGRWANACCSHPRSGEETIEAAYRRVRQELGCEAVSLREIGWFIYRAEFPDGICEYECDHVLAGRCAGEPVPDPAEVSGIRWVSAETLNALLTKEPETFAPWAYQVLSLALNWLG